MSATGDEAIPRQEKRGETLWDEYVRRMQAIRRDFGADSNGLRAVGARTALVDELLKRLWEAEVSAATGVGRGVAVVAIGGYGRAQLFPHSDIDVLFCVEKGDPPREAIRRVTQALWDCGLRVSPVTRALADCERFDPHNPEFGLSLLERRLVAGDGAVAIRLGVKAATKMMARDGKAMRAEVLSLTRQRHARYGETLFHLEPNIKECPGGLRDANVCGWLALLRGSVETTHEAARNASGDEFADAVRFLAAVRCFLHFRHDRDDNVLDWQAQDAAAGARVGLGEHRGGRGQKTDNDQSAQKAHKIDAAYWMRTYFRHARVVERRLLFEMQAAGLRATLPSPRKVRVPEQHGFRLRGGWLEMDSAAADGADPAAEPDLVLELFAAMARTGTRPAHDTEVRIAEAIPLLSAHLEEGPGLWRNLSKILTGPFAGAALRLMHALGVLDLIVPEFHCIDALVIRDAYHRYTVDEHTFVVIDTLHGLEAEPPPGAPEWRLKLGQMARELQNPGLLFLAALLHDTGKGRTGGNHARESATMARAVLGRLEMDSYESGMVIRLIETHLEMSAALRRDIFDAETVRGFAGKVQTHEALRMLTLFTYADIHAVHPDALTPWKAENLWRLSMSAANQMDRSVDEERVHSGTATGGDDRVERLLASLPGRARELKAFLEGFPARYLTTRSAEQIKQHMEMAGSLAEEPLQIALHCAPSANGGSSSGGAINEITLITRDRPSLFARMAGALAAWGMNVVTADAYANADGVVVDSFRFTDVFRTLELNASECDRFVQSVRDMVSGKTPVETMLAGRRRARKKVPRVVVETKVDFDEQASSHSTLMQVVAQDVPGLLRAVSRTLSGLGYNVEVALVDTEGETAIDVFYLTRRGARLTVEEEETLRVALVEAIDENAR